MILKSYKEGMLVHLLTPVDKLNALLTAIASKLDGLSGVEEVCSLFRSTTWGEQVLEYSTINRIEYLIFLSIHFSFIYSSPLRRLPIRLWLYAKHGRTSYRNPLWIFLYSLLFLWRTPPNSEIFRMSCTKLNFRLLIEICKNGSCGTQSGQTCRRAM